MHLWLFGYGSLIWRPDIDYIDRRPARVQGWSRRFWQGSHDHRGLPDAPGRVVTLIRETSATCDGMAYLVDREVVDETFSQLDHREKNGYERHQVNLEFHQSGEGAEGVVYIAPVDNFAYLGPAPLEEMAQQIHRSVGPSGHNIEYLTELADALRALDAEDEHVFELEAAVREITL
ncbi:MAG: gamma-glutamylcyclotransferase [Gammaproteobacteria bacterium]|jgi:cation transport regulator ChaC|nr:MAG: gamma-glutamylcyclotransferase [Gammaproteobacteria bacterium]